MSAVSNVNSLVGATTRYIAGRNAMQTVYWRTSSATNGKMLKYNKTCEFDKSQQLPPSIRFQNFNHTFKPQ
ncbi:uncharacterized protein LOC119668984 [Teleopsis dalmanni]|uniref:uncharacterized protein LOC119668984 n=1 Tax=Teleopsis dalmanni TaxID=139649 RepID=UPI0018CD900B|nr:uncharacterized protein LOC119668984 [Teleopsis dalmanni]